MADSVFEQALASSPGWSAHTRWLDLTPGFVDAQGQQVAALFTDGLHPNQAGNRVWRDRLLQRLQPALRRVPEGDGIEDSLAGRPIAGVRVRSVQAPQFLS